MNKFLSKFLRLYISLSSNPIKITRIWKKLGVDIGEGTYIYRNVVLSTGENERITIGKNCVLTGCTVLAHDASTNRLLGLKYGEPSISRPVTIEDECFIGYGAIILMGVTIGKGSIIGAGAVVTKDVPPNSVVAGNPAKIIMSTFELLERRKQEILLDPSILPHNLVRKS